MSIQIVTEIYTAQLAHRFHEYEINFRVPSVFLYQAHDKEQSDISHFYILGSVDGWGATLQTGR
jgi:hypothetical protein